MPNRFTKMILKPYYNVRDKRVLNKGYQSLKEGVDNLAYDGPQSSKKKQLPPIPKRGYINKAYERSPPPRKKKKSKKKWVTF